MVGKILIHQQHQEEELEPALITPARRGLSGQRHYGISVFIADTD